MYTIDLSGKAGVVAGVANKWSIAWAIAQILHEAGMQLILPYSRERRKKGIEKMVAAEGWKDVFIPPQPCNAGDDIQVQGLFDFVKKEIGYLNCFAHCIAFAPPDTLQGEFRETSREAFNVALDISAFSFVSMTRAASELMSEGGSVIALTFMASKKVFPSYNVMGTAKAALEHSVKQLAYELSSRNIRVNAISPGIVSTKSARGVKGFGDFRQTYQEHTPLRRMITQKEVGKTAMFLLSDLSSGITGEVIHVDGGYNILGGQFQQ